MPVPLFKMSLLIEISVRERGTLKTKFLDATAPVKVEEEILNSNKLFNLS
jgi:hypothetical protein